MKKMMQKYRVLAVAVLALVAVALAPSIAQGGLRTTYKHRYQELVKRHGVKTAGCNLITDRWDNRCKGKTTKADIRKSNVVLSHMLTVPKPAPTPVMASTATAPASSSATPVSTSSGLPSCTWAPESGGDYGAYNPSSGASGKYQVIPSTHAAYCSDLGQSPGDQEECARRIYEGQGPGAWVNC